MLKSSYFRGNDMNPSRNERALIRLSMLFVLLLSGLSACGQKGDLYLPDGKQATLVRPANNT
jgi:predicted small lipoprotein YifL